MSRFSKDLLCHQGKIRISVFLVVSLCVSLGLSIAYTLQWNPEIRFWKQAADGKLSAVRNLREQHQGPVVLCYGGSTTTFGIDAGFAWKEEGYPLVNLGLHAGMGADALSGFALSELREGDTLLVMLEPHLIVKDESRTPLGEQFTYGMEKPEILNWRTRSPEPVQFIESLPNLRPGALNIFSMTGKALLGRPIYRYRVENMEEGGLVTTDVRNELAGRKGVPDHLPEHAKHFLKELVAEVEAKGANAVYCLPWAFFDSRVLEVVRRNRLTFLQDLELIMPVVREPELGIHTVREDFADTPQHLTATAARMRTAKLVVALRKAGIGN